MGNALVANSVQDLAIHPILRKISSSGFNYLGEQLSHDNSQRLLCIRYYKVEAHLSTLRDSFQGNEQRLKNFGSNFLAMLFSLKNTIRYRVEREIHHGRAKKFLRRS